MQWLIDIIKSWVQQEGYLTASFVDRGDVSAHDWRTADLTATGSWQGLNLYPIVPIEAKAVLMGVTLKNTLSGSWFKLRTMGNLYSINVSERRTILDMVQLTWDMIVAPNGSGEIEYAASSGGWHDIDLVVRGWWL